MTTPKQKITKYFLELTIAIPVKFKTFQVIFFFISDIVLRLDLGQISFNLVENAFATRQLALLATKITFYDLLARACAAIKNFSPFLFLLFFSFCCSVWPFTGLACGGKTFKKESSSGPIFTMEQLGVRKFCSEFFAHHF